LLANDYGLESNCFPGDLLLLTTVRSPAPALKAYLLPRS